MVPISTHTQLDQMDLEIHDVPQELRLEYTISEQRYKRELDEAKKQLDEARVIDKMHDTGQHMNTIGLQTFNNIINFHGIHE